MVLNDPVGRSNLSPKKLSTDKMVTIFDFILAILDRKSITEKFKVKAHVSVLALKGSVALLIEDTTSTGDTTIPDASLSPAVPSPLLDTSFSISLDSFY